MGVARLLVALHPKCWREEYGEEFAALLDESRLSPSAVLDVVTHAAKLQIGAHSGPLLVIAAVIVSVCSEAVALRAGLTANILWAPTNPDRALALFAVVSPWAGLLGRAQTRQRSRSAT
jgi:hypothetical protein